MARQRWRCQLKNTIDTGPCIILSMVSADQLYYVLYVLYYIMYYIILCIVRPWREHLVLRLGDPERIEDLLHVRLLLQPRVRHAPCADQRRLLHA